MNDDDMYPVHNLVLQTESVCFHLESEVEQ